MSLDEATLEQVAKDGEMDYAKWPSIIGPLLERLNYIAYNEWPLPSYYPVVNTILPSQRMPTNNDQLPEPTATLVSQTPNTPRTLPPIPPFPGSAASNIPDSQPPPPSSPPQAPESSDPPKPELPTETYQTLTTITTTLEKFFSQKPPHTIQRLAELILEPSKHYRNLPAWLRALDRIVAVSSTADIFPLDESPPTINGGLNGSNPPTVSLFGSHDSRNGYDKDSLGSDEALGGALLTPIPWLKEQRDLSSDSEASASDLRAKVEDWEIPSADSLLGSDSSSSPTSLENLENATISDAQALAHIAEEQQDLGIEPREDGAVTQGELIRMEQEAGIIPVPAENMSAGRTRTGDVGIEIDDEVDGLPHARGPDVVGTVDMGLVGGRERQLRISSPPLEEGKEVDANDAQEVLAGSAKEKEKDGSSSGSSTEDYVDVGKDDMQVDATKNGEDDDDIVLVDADGAEDDGKKDTVKPGVDATEASSG